MYLQYVLVDALGRKDPAPARILPQIRMSKVKAGFGLCKSLKPFEIA